MKAKYKEKWIKALKSGKYKQGHRRLHNKENNTYCCLGVLQKINKVKNSHENSHFRAIYYLSENLLEKFGMTENEQKILSEMNDEQGKNFIEIANYIEKHL